MSKQDQSSKDTPETDKPEKDIAEVIVTSLERSLKGYTEITGYTMMKDLVKDTMEIRIVVSK